MIEANVSMRKRLGLMYCLFRGLRFKIGLQVSGFFGVKKNEDRNNCGDSSGEALRMAFLESRSLISFSKATLCASICGIGVDLRSPL